MKVISLADLQQGFSYLVSNPSFLLRSIVNATRMRFGVPMDAVQWLLGKVARGKLPKDLQLAAVQPGLRASATVNVMGAAMLSRRWCRWSKCSWQATARVSRSACATCRSSRQPTA